MTKTLRRTDDFRMEFDRNDYSGEQQIVDMVQEAPQGRDSSRILLRQSPRPPESIPFRSRFDSRPFRR